jgi:excisionase family DNA binding protein
MRARKSMLKDLQGCNALPPLLSVTIKDAVLLTGICRSTLYELIQQGTLPISKIGRTTLVSYRALCALVGATRDVHNDVAASDQNRALKIETLTTDHREHRQKSVPTEEIAKHGSASRRLRQPTILRQQEDFFDLLVAPRANLH